MNIFILDLDFEKCAHYHCDKHIVKMPLEAAQMLCTNTFIDQELGFIPRKLEKDELSLLKSKVDEKLRHVEPEERSIRYLPTMHNHPCTIWARSSLENFFWLHNYANALGHEYWYRYGKNHKSIDVINSLPDIENMEDVGLTPFAEAMPDEYKNDDAVQAYREYYMGAKADIVTWSHRQQPEWWSG